MNYDELIYELLAEHLPGIASALAELSVGVETVSGYVSDVFNVVEQYRLFIAVIAFTAVLALIFKRRYLI